MKQVKKDLQKLSQELKALAKKTDKVIKEVGKLGQAKSTRQKKIKPETMKKSPAKKATAMTATEQVFKIIKASKNGVDAPTLMKKTGFEDRKVRNVIFRAFKQGKIKRAGRGTYVAT